MRAPAEAADARPCVPRFRLRSSLVLRLVSVEDADDIAVASQSVTSYN